ncbi:MAG: hypothetical protein ACXWUG_14995 [Polyangiales bacterium]
MRRLLLLAISIGCHSTAEPDPAAPDAVPQRPVATCLATHTADGPACVPRFDACAEGEVALLGGGCKAVGVPVDGCAPGFVHDGKSGCAPVLPKDSCPAGQLAVPGDATCAEIAPCGDGTWGAIPDGPSTVFVDPTAKSGGSGTRAAPFATLADALATDATTIALAEGEYAGDVVLDRARTLIGRCPSKVKLVGASTDPTAATVAMSSNTTISGISITGPACGVRVERASVGVAIDHVWIHGTGGYGAWLRGGAVSIRRTLVEDVSEFGVAASGAKAEVVESVVRDVRETSDGAAGLQANPDLANKIEASLTLTRSVVERASYSGVTALASTVTVDGSVVRDSVPFSGDGKHGYGLASLSDKSWPTPAKLVVRRSLVAHNAYAGVLSRDGDAIVESTIVRDTTASKDGTYGRGLVVQSSKRTVRFELRDSLVEKNRETGVDVDFDVDALIERTVVRDTVATATEGRGIFGEAAAKAPRLVCHELFVTRNPRGGVGSTGSLELTGSRITDNGGFGVANRGGTAIVRATLIDRIGPNAEGLDGHGVYAEPDERKVPISLEVSDTLVSHVRKAGIAAFGGTLVIAQTAVRDVTPEEASGLAGMGVVFQRASPSEEPLLDLRATLVERTSRAGAYLAAVGGTLDGLYARDVVAAGASFGDGLLVAGVMFPPLATDTLTVKGSIFERNARSGIGLFGSALAVSGSWMQCNAIDLDVESSAAWNGVDEAVPHPFDLADGGSNVCGCGAEASCRADTANLRPAPASEPPKK